MNKTTNLCYRRSCIYYIRWALCGLLICIACSLAMIALLGEEALTWPAYIIPVIGIVSFVVFVRSLLLMFSPERGKLGKSVRPYMDGTIHTDVHTVFARIDKDIMQNGRKFGAVWVGKEWVLGEGAMRIDRIRGVFSRIRRGGKQREYVLYLVDDRKNVQSTYLIREKPLREVCDYLVRLLPRVATGNDDDCAAFVAKSADEMAAFNEGFLTR